MERQPKKLRTATEKGALWHEYDFLVHQFVAHLRRVHPSNKAIMMEIPSAGKVSVKAADPLAKPEIPLYYTHSKTHLYNDIFFHFWDNVMTPTLGNICPWMAVTSKKSLEQLFDFKFDRFVLFFWLVLYKIKLQPPLTCVRMTGQMVRRCRFCLKRHCISWTKCCGCCLLQPIRI
jgi:hypothetical protein